MALLILTFGALKTGLLSGETAFSSIFILLFSDLFLLPNVIRALAARYLSNIKYSNISVLRNVLYKMTL